MGITFQIKELEKQLRLFKRQLPSLHFAEAYNNMGITFNDQGKPEEAIEAYMGCLHQA